MSRKQDLKAQIPTVIQRRDRRWSIRFR